ncbi:CHAD domain-containing protein [Ensifer sp. 4252]|uniref:CYTH and CHAD domain-containing protein n=1 Tax=Ensifer sp. 4252 TaxID=3373915 RepID=UPI003D1F2B66
MAEIELKLEVLPADLDRLVGSDMLGEPVRIVQQHDTYFDTSDRTMLDAGFTLRVRKAGEARIQTVKATGAGASIFARSEWEVNITGENPVIDHSTPLLNEFGAGIDVKPQFEISIDRRVWGVDEGSSKIEAVLDEGAATAAERRTQILELELELKDGQPKDLFVLARKIEAVIPIKLGVLSKAERGFWLLEAARTVVKAEPVELTRSMTSCQAFQAIAQSCFRQFRLNENIVVARKTPEALHQARVALRRLRSAITLFKPLFADETAKRISGEFRWLAGVLGEARDLDVLLSKAPRGDLREQLADNRALTYDNVLAALASARARGLMLDFNEWIHCGDYLDSPETRETRQKPVAEFAIQALEKARKKMKKHGRDLAHRDDEQRHEARKDAKKLRYAAEFFGSLFSDKRGSRRFKRFIASMGLLQDELGALNDLVSGPDVLRMQGLLEHPDAQALVSHANKASLIGKAQGALDDVIDSKRFWR